MLDKEQKTRLKRLTHEPPIGNYEALHNTAYVKDRKVFLRGCGTRGNDINLCDYCRDQCRENCGMVIPDVPEEEFGEFMIGCECTVSLLYAVAIGAAEMREKLMRFENAEESEAGKDG